MRTWSSPSLGVPNLDNVALRWTPDALINGTATNDAVTLELPPIPPMSGGSIQSQYAWAVTIFAQQPNPVPLAMQRLGFFDGYRLYLNLTLGDLDGDGSNDLHMWYSNATRAEAESMAADERRAQPTKLNVRVIVQEFENLTRIRFELLRYDGTHDGAWLELRDADRLLTKLFNGTLAASPAYALDLPPLEGFVEHDGTTLWVWVEHFSTRTLTVDVPKEADAATPPTLGTGTDTSSSTTPEGRKDSPMPLWLGLGALAFGLALLRKRQP